MPHSIGAYEFPLIVKLRMVSDWSSLGAIQRAVAVNGSFPAALSNLVSSDSLVVIFDRWLTRLWPPWSFVSYMKAAAPREGKRFGGYLPPSLSSPRGKVCWHDIFIATTLWETILSVSLSEAQLWKNVLMTLATGARRHAGFSFSLVKVEWFFFFLDGTILEAFKEQFAICLACRTWMDSAMWDTMRLFCPCVIEAAGMCRQLGLFKSGPALGHGSKPYPVPPVRQTSDPLDLSPPLICHQTEVPDTPIVFSAKPFCDLLLGMNVFGSLMCCHIWKATAPYWCLPSLTWWPQIMFYICWYK